MTPEYDLFDLKKPQFEANEIAYKIAGKTDEEQWMHCQLLDAYLLRQYIDGGDRRPCVPDMSASHESVSLHYSSYSYSNKRHISSQRAKVLVLKALAQRYSELSTVIETIEEVGKEAAKRDRLLKRLEDPSFCTAIPHSTEIRPHQLELLPNWLRKPSEKKNKPLSEKENQELNEKLVDLIGWVEPSYFSEKAESIFVKSLKTAGKLPDLRDPVLYHWRFLGWRLLVQEHVYEFARGFDDLQEKSFAFNRMCSPWPSEEEKDEQRKFSRKFRTAIIDQCRKFSENLREVTPRSFLTGSQPSRKFRATLEKNTPEKNSIERSSMESTRVTENSFTYYITTPIRTVDAVVNMLMRLSEWLPSPEGDSADKELAWLGSINGDQSPFTWHQAKLAFGSTCELVERIFYRFEVEHKRDPWVYYKNFSLIAVTDEPLLPYLHDFIAQDFKKIDYMLRHVTWNLAEDDEPLAKDKKSPIKDKKSPAKNNDAFDKEIPPAMKQFGYGEQQSNDRKILAHLREKYKDSFAGLAPTTDHFYEFRFIIMKHLKYMKYQFTDVPGASVLRLARRNTPASPDIVSYRK